MSIVFTSASIDAQVVNTFPFNEDFESWTLCSSTAGSACALPTPWLNELGDDIDWTTDNNGTSSSPTGPTANGGADHTTGVAGGKYLYTESSSPANPNKVANLDGPWFDFTGLTAPRINYWYHMFGTSMGTMTLQVRTAVSGIGAWTTVVPAYTGNVDAWQEMDVDLMAYAGLDSVQIRWVGVTGSSFLSDMAIDDVTVYEPAPYDLLMVSIDSLPANACGLGIEDVWCTINQIGSIGFSIGDTLFFNYNDGTNVINDTVILTAPLGPGGVYNHMFSQLVDYSASGAYNITVTVNNYQDLNIADNSVSTQVYNIPIISGLPYYENFEADNGGWTAGGTNQNWEWGVPNGTFVYGSTGCSPSDSMVWTTGLTTPYPNNTVAYLESPCIDFSTLLADPMLTFDHIFETESGFEDHWVEVSLDGGTSWSVLGGIGTGLNWYNQTSSWDGNSGLAGQWRTAAHVLTGTAGVSDVRIRYVLTSDGSVQYDGAGVDNIKIDVVSAFVDASPTSLDSPVSSCGLTNSEVVSATFTNSGQDPVSSFDVCYSINGGALNCETIVAAIPAGGTYVHNFAVAGDFSAVGAYNVTLVISTPDLNQCNDTAYMTVQNKPIINTFPYLEKFENGPGGWEAENGANGTWELATPAATTIVGAASGQNAWVTNATGNYNNSDNSSVVSPCFDFTSLSPGSWVAMKVWWNAEFSWDGANLQYSFDGITWTNIGAFGDPNNWYTDNSINGAPGGSQEGWSGRESSGNGSGGWVNASHPLDDVTFGGQPSVIFRVNFGSDGSVIDEGFAFDNFAIGVPPTVDLGADFVGCANYEIDLGLPGDYAWYGEDITTFTSTLFSTSPVGVFTNPSANDTTYNGILVYTDSLGLSGMDTVMLTLSPAPYNVLNDTTICSDATVTYAVGTDANYTYNWNNGSTISTSTYGAAGLVEVIVLNTISGCADSASAMVYQTQPVAVNDATFCAGDSAMLDATNMFSSYLWSTSETTSVIYVSAAGTYTISTTDSIGCMSADTVIVTMNALPTPSISGVPDTICINYDIVGSGDAGYTTYNWSTGGSAQSETISGSALGLGSHVITLTVEDAAGCIGTTNQTLVVDACAGLDELTLSFNLYPNPSTGIFNFTTEGEMTGAEMILTDILGKQIWSKDLKTVNGIIDLSTYENGTYLLNIKQGESSKVVRLIKQ